MSPVQSADILEITKLGVNEAETRLVNITLNRKFYYESDYELTCVTEIIGSGGVLKNVYTNQIYGDALKSGENTISLGINLPAGFDKATDKIRIYPVTKLSTKEAVESDDDLTATASGNTVTLTKVPTFDEGSKILVLVTKAGSNDTSVKGEDVLFFDKFNAIEANTSLACLDTVSGAYTVKVSGTINGVHTVKSYKAQ